MPSARPEIFSCRISHEERMLIIRMRGRLESDLGRRVSLGDVVREGMRALDVELQKKKPVVRGA